MIKPNVARAVEEFRRNEVAAGRYRKNPDGETRPLFDDGDPKLSFEEAWFMAMVGAGLAGEKNVYARKKMEKKPTLSVAVLEGWVETAQQKKRARRRRYMASAACIAVICCGTLGVANSLIPDSVIAGKNAANVTEEGNNTIVKIGDGEAGEVLGSDEIVEPDWNQVAKLKKNYPEMLVPGYVPEGYAFKELRIEVSELFNTYTYVYMQGEEQCEIVQVQGSDMKMIKNYSRIIVTESGIEVRIKEDECKNGFFFKEESLCNIEGEISDGDYIKIIDDLER